MTHYISPSITRLANAINTYGETISPRDAATTELIGISMTWPMGTYPVRAKMPKKLASVEGVALVAGLYDLDLIMLAAPAVNPVLFTQSSKYSLSIAKQVPHVVNMLKKDPSTRRAIMYFGKVADVGTDRTTCLTSLQWLVRDGRLHCVLNMRSWDLAFGLPIDVVAVTVLSLAVAKFLAVLPGTFHAHAGSLHIYESSAARALSAEPSLGTVEVAFEKPSGYRTWTEVRDEARQHFSADAPPWEWVKVS